MNTVIDTIMNRRSVRFYTDKKIPREQMEAIIQAGNYAPNGAGTQMWRFVIVEDDDFRKKLAVLALPRYKKWMENAPDGFKAVRDKIDSEVEMTLFQRMQVSALSFIMIRNLICTSAGSSGTEELLLSKNRQRDRS